MKVKNITTEEYHLALSILRYLLKRPNAKDTLEGISRWWILKEYIDHQMSQVEDALEYLVGEEFIDVKKIFPDTRIYQLNKNNISKIKSVIKEASPEI